MSEKENLVPVRQPGSRLNGESLNHSRILVNHILAPTDLSDESRETLDYAVRLAEHFHAKLTLAHVWTTPRSHTGVLGAVDPEGVQRSKERAEFILRGLEDIIRERHLDTESYFLIGNPRRQIMAVAESSKVDLILISTHDYDWLTRVFEGSDSEQILRHASCPVWIVRNVVNNTGGPRVNVK
jgi:nucleotide-binding universal stress UspA family protein